MRRRHRHQLWACSYKPPELSPVELRLTTTQRTLGVLSDISMCSEIATEHCYHGQLWLEMMETVPTDTDTRVGTSLNVLDGKDISGRQTHPLACTNFPNIAGIMCTYEIISSLPLATATPIRQGLFAKSHHQMNSTVRNRLVNPAAYSTTSSDQSLGARTVTGVGAELAGDDADADADSEAESDTSQCFDSESEDIEEPENDDDDDQEHVYRGEREFEWDSYRENRYAMDGDDDTAMTNMDPPSSPVFAAITNQNKKPRRCKLSRKHYSVHGLSGTQRSMTSPAVLDSAMDIDMDAPAEEDPDDSYNDSSADEDTDGYAYSAWFGGIYHPIWLGHATASGKKRRDNVQEEDAGEDRNVQAGMAAELGRRHIRLPRRKRAWKASQGTRSSVGESEWSLTVNHPLPLPLGGSAVGAMPSPPMSPAPITATQQIHTASRSTQPRHRQTPARALERRLENLRVEDLGRQTTSTTINTTTTTTTANDLRPRMASDQHKKKRIRYQQATSFEVASVESTGDVITPPMYWDLEEPMGLRPSGVDEQWNPQEFGMTGVEVNMSSPMSGVMPLGVSERAKDISRVLEGVEDLL